MKNKKIAVILVFIFLMLYMGCYPNKLDEYVDTKIQLSSIAWDGEYFWGIDSINNELVKFDINSGKVEGTYPIGHECIQGLCFNSGNLWISTCTGKILRVSTDGVLEKIYSPVNYTVQEPDFTGIIGIGYVYYILDRNYIVELDDAFYYRRHFEIPAKKYGGITWDGTYLVLVGRGGSIYYIDPGTGEVDSELKVCGPGKIYGITFDDENFWLSLPTKHSISKLKID